MLRYVFALLVFFTTAVPASAQDPCRFLCEPTLLIEPTITFEKDGTVFETIFALDLSTPIPRVGITLEAITKPFSDENDVELESELKLYWLVSDQTGGWVSSHFDIVDKFSGAERPTDTRGYTHKLNLERDTSVAMGVPIWSPDGKQLVFRTYAKHPDDHVGGLAMGRLAVVPAEGGVPRLLTEDFDEQSTPLAWKSDGIYFAARQRTFQHLFRLDPITGAIRRLTEPLESLNFACSFNRDATQMAFVRADAKQYQEVFVGPVGRREIRPAAQERLRQLRRQAPAVPRLAGDDREAPAALPADAERHALVRPRDRDRLTVERQAGDGIQGVADLTRHGHLPRLEPPFLAHGRARRTRDGEDRPGCGRRRRVPRGRGRVSTTGGRDERDGDDAVAAQHLPSRSMRGAQPAARAMPAGSLSGRTRRRPRLPRRRDTPVLRAP